MLKKFIKADLHIHTNYSDGKFSVEETIKFASLKGIEVLSFTEHDCFCNVELASETCNKFGIKFISGIEFSTDFNGKEIHILGYGLDHNNPELNNILNGQSERRLLRFRDLIANLNSLGIEIEYKEFMNSFPKSKALGRMHIAEMLKQRKYVKSINEAFYKYIGDNGIANVNKKNYTTGDIIKLIKKLNGISVLAHPGKNYLNEKLDELIELGIDGIEIIHPSHNNKTTKFFKNFADKYGLIKTGGSDFHGLTEYEAKNLGKYYINIEPNFLEKYYIN